MDFDYTQNFIDEVKGTLKRPSGDGGGTTDYDSLENKPSINNVLLTGNKNTDDLHLTDDTLSKKGIPADSKIVGQKIETQDTQIDTIKSTIETQGTQIDTIKSTIETQGTQINEKASCEEGVFSPTIINSSIQPSSVAAEYKKVGKIVHIAIKFVFSTAVDTAQIYNIIGLPFVVNIDNATSGRYLLCAETTNGSYAGMAIYDNYMASSPCVDINAILDKQTTKIIRLYGQYETTN